MDRCRTRAGNTEFLGGWASVSVAEPSNFGPYRTPPPVSSSSQYYDRKTGIVRAQRKSTGTLQLGRMGLNRASSNVCIVRTDRTKGGTEALSAIIVERGTPGIDYQVIDKNRSPHVPERDHRFHDVACPRKTCSRAARGPVINRNFTWSGPIAGIGGGRDGPRCLDSPEMGKTYTGAGSSPIINTRLSTLLAEVAQNRAARYIVEDGHSWICTRAGEGAGGNEQGVLPELMQNVSSIVCASSASMPSTSVSDREGVSPSRSSTRCTTRAMHASAARRGRDADSAFSADTFVDCKPFRLQSQWRIRPRRGTWDLR